MFIAFEFDSHRAISYREIIAPSFLFGLSFFDLHFEFLVRICELLLLFFFLAIGVAGGFSLDLELIISVDLLLLLRFRGKLFFIFAFLVSCNSGVS